MTRVIDPLERPDEQMLFDRPGFGYSSAMSQEFAMSNEDVRRFDVAVIGAGSGGDTHGVT